MSDSATSSRGRSRWASFASAILMLLFAGGSHAIAGASPEQVCDVAADYPLGAEDYPQAIRLHEDLIRRQPGNALAHYHLGFAQGMAGDRPAEIREYQRAAALGLNDWDLFLNLGMAQLEDGDLDSATASLRRAVLLGARHPESHFNLALVEVQRGMLADAERETLLSLRLNPPQPDARNLLGVIYAQQGHFAKASLVWRELLTDAPDYQPARTNLSLLGSQTGVAPAETAAVPLLPTAAVTPPDQPKAASLNPDTEPAYAPLEKIGGQMAWAR
jgi:Flp pilus assembly protein TadD